MITNKNIFLTNNSEISKQSKLVLSNNIFKKAYNVKKILCYIINYIFEIIKIKKIGLIHGENIKFHLT